MHKITQISENLKLITENIGWVSTVSAGIWIRTGSRNESHETQGISHLFEHMVFKGTKTRSAWDIAWELESRGGELNAFTTREYTCFYVRVAKKDLKRALVLLCDLVTNPVFRQEDFEKEKQVVLEEIRSYEDNPEESVHELYAKAQWKKGGIQYPIAGSLASVRKLTLNDLKQHHKKVLARSEIVVSAAGNIKHSELLKVVRENLNLKYGNILKPEQSESTTSHLVHKKNIMQCNLVLGTALNKGDSSQKFCLSLFNAIFGDGMTSRLYQKVREEAGLAYTIYSSTELFTDARNFNIFIGTDGEKVEQSLEIIHRESMSVLVNGVTDKELKSAKDSVAGHVLMCQDSVSQRMNRLARLAFSEDDPEPISETIKRLRLIKKSQINEIAEKIFLSGQWATASVVPKEYTGPKPKTYTSFR
jgi:predicted Zn-dependent peptidase